jgi:OPA family glycerol-3-phosphate transporter-like MFS transporter
MSRYLDPPASKPLLPKDKIPKVYKSMRIKVFLGAFLGYAGYYLVRKNLSLAAPGMLDSGLIDKEGIGIAMSAVSIAYAFSKFIMGSISDRSDARKFLVIGLVLAAVTMIVTGLLPFGANTTINVAMIFVLMLIVGWISGMGWPPCGRIMAHWFSQNERSFKMSVWNTSHTLGGGTLGLLSTLGMTILLSMGFSQTWRGAFIFPAIIALVIAVFCWWALRDTPQSCGLPSINDYRHDYSGVKTNVKDDEKIPFKNLFVDYVFKNKFLWIIALANAFVYMVRYGVGDWAPIYLQESGLMSPSESNLAFALHNYAGIPGTIVCGWISAKFFKGRCTPPNVIFMSLVLIGTLMYWQAGNIAGFFVNAQAAPAAYASLSKVLIYFALILVGFCIYGPVALIGIQALNLVPKNAAGTAAGFVGLFGYLFGDAILSKLLMGTVAQDAGWHVTFMMLSVASVIAGLLCASTWKSEKKIAENS